MISIGGVTLDNDLVVNGLNTSAGSDSSVSYTIGGAGVITNTVKISISTIGFTSEEGYGWQKYSTVQSLLSLEKTGEVYNVDVNGNTFEGLFSGGLVAEKVFKSIPDGHINDFYKVTFNIIKLN